MTKPLILFFLVIAFRTAVAQTIVKDCEMAQSLPQTVDYCSGNDQYNNQNPQKSTWFQFTATAVDVNISVSGAGSGGTLINPQIKLYSDCSGTELVGNNLSGNNVTSLYKGGLVIGNTYYIEITGENDGTGTYKLCLNNYNPVIKPGQDCATASFLCSTAAISQQNVVGAGQNNDEAKGTCLSVSLFIPGILLAQNTFPSSGNAGIGTTSPQAPLDITVSATVGTSNIPFQNFTTSGAGIGAQFFISSKTSTSSQFFINFPNPSSGTGNWLGYRFGSATNKWYFGDDGTHAYFQTIHDMRFGTNAGSDPSTSNTPAMVISTSQTVGIGTTTPLSTLQVNGTMITSGTSANFATGTPATLPNNLANTGQMLIGWNRNTGSGETDFIGNQGTGTTGGFAFYNHNNSNTETQLMWIQGNGNVAIGTTDTKGYKLAVNGNVVANSVTVKPNANWPDFVFSKKYRLTPLMAVANYIAQYHHLPEMPDASKVQESGINVGEMNRLLLKKVEELTLYMIEKDKQISQEHSLIENQQSEINELKRQVSSLSLEIGHHK